MMSLNPSWSLRCVAALLIAQLASACGGGGTDPNPNPNPQDTAAPTTRATPAGGSFTSQVAVALACDDGSGSGCAATYYTLDGSSPGTSSTRYREPFTLSATTTVRFFSVDTAGNTEAAKTEQYTFTGTQDIAAPNTSATPAGGAYNSPRSVALACNDGTGSGCAATHYTLDGSVPTEASPRYTAPLAISATTTLRFFSVDTAGNVEGTRTERYVLDTEVPTLSASPRGGTFGGSRVVTLACDDGNGSGCAAIHYTTDGSIPSEASARYSAPISLTTTTRLRFLAVDRAGNASEPGSELYTLDATGPVSTATPPGGTYATTQRVTLTCDDGTGSGCAAIHYTTDGFAPTRDSALYQVPVQLSSNTVLRFFAVDAVGNAGSVQTQTYTIDTAAPLTAATPAGGTFGGDTQVSLSCDDGQGGSGCAATRYTLDGTAPGDTSPLYTGALTVTSSVTLRFFSVDAAGNREPARAVSFTFDRTAPTTTPSLRGGNFAGPQTVSLACSDTGGSTCEATYFTTDGTPPSTSSTRYTAPLSISANTTLRFFSVDALGNAEPAKSEAYVIDTTPPTTTATPAAGSYRAAQDVVLACNDGAGVGCSGSIRYTTDPVAPTGSFLAYTGAIRISTTSTLRFFSQDGVGNIEAVKSAAYVIDTVAPTVAASPRGGAYFTQQTVTLTCNDTGSGCAAIHYTVTGATPTTGSPRYEGALTVSTNTTLAFIAVDAVGNTSPVVVETYTFSSDTTAPVTTASPAGGAYPSARSVTLTCVDNGGGSGCAGTFYTLDGTEPSTSSTRYTAPFTVSTSTQVRFRSVDTVGNLEASKSVSYVIDTVAPVTQVTPAGGSYQDPVTVTLSCSDTGSGCRETRYTTDGTAPSGSSPLYSVPLTFTQTTTLRFFSVDQAGNAEAARQEAYELPFSNANASAQLAAVRGAVDGPVLMPVDGAFITYVKPGVGNLTNDPAGFFLQAERAGPALFVEVDPTGLFPTPQAGMRVSVTVSNKRMASGMVRANISAYSVLSSGHLLDALVQNVSNVDVPAVVGEYEAELISLSGTVSGTFFTAGSGHSQANLSTAGVPEGSANSNLFRLRIVDSVRDQLEVTTGCTVSIVSPLWLFVTAPPTITQPSVWEAQQVKSLVCPGPRVTSAQATGQGTVIVRFDRQLNASSVLANGSQFSIPGVTVTGATAVTNTEVWVSTSNQTPRQVYTVTVASTVRDSAGTGVPSTGNTTTFKGWTTPAVLRITEVAPGVPLGRDLVELIVLQGGTTDGMTLVELSTSPNPLATLPDVNVVAGELIVIHLNPDKVTAGADAPSSETLSSIEFQQFQYASNYDTAWDFHGGTTGVSQGNRVLRIRDSLGNTMDALAAAVPGNVTAAYLPFLQGLQAEGLWLPSDCSGTLCTYSSFPTAHDVSVNWAGTFPSGGRATTLGRVTFGDSNHYTDWAVGTGTLGLYNP